jgi:cyclic-di-AMP phosphodiesterase PgpH
MVKMSSVWSKVWSLQEERNRKNNFGLKRFLLGLFFLIFIATFLHFREVPLEVLELNSIAPRYVVAQIDFDFPDQDATFLLRQEATKDIGPIFKINKKEIEHRRSDFEKELLDQQYWREQFPSMTFEQMYKGIELLESALLNFRYTDPRTFQKKKDLNLITAYDHMLPPLSQLQSPIMPNECWRQLREKLFIAQGFDPAVADFILGFFEQNSWNMTKDAAAERALRRAAQEHIIQKITHVATGSHIIDPGEKVTSRHLVMLQAMKDALESNKNHWAPFPIASNLVFAFVLIVVSALYIRFFNKEVFYSLEKLTLLAGIIFTTLFLSKCAEYFLLHQSYHFIEVVRYPLFVPFAALLICILVGWEVAMFASVLLTITLGVTLAVDHDRFLMINFIAAAVTILCARSVHKRKQIFAVCAKVTLICLPVVLAFNLADNFFWNTNVLYDLFSVLGFMLLTAILSIGVLYIVESAFHVMTDMALMEFMDPDNKLLRRLSVEAPGTYQHSLIVGNLAESAARAIGANGLFCRVSSLYHDVGKLFNPHYFTENQLGGFNMHQLLTPTESAQVIIAHVAEGEALAKKYHLPQSFIDVICEHHGTTLVYYFYHKQIELMQHNIEAVDEKKFRYPGLKPRTKESAIIMIADTIEAASHSLEEVSEESVAEMVEKLVSEKIEDGQLEECQLTFEELGIVKKMMVKTLVVTRHLRIKYPAKPGVVKFSSSLKPSAYA